MSSSHCFEACNLYEKSAVRRQHLLHEKWKFVQSTLFIRRLFCKNNFVLKLFMGEIWLFPYHRFPNIWKTFLQCVSGPFSRNCIMIIRKGCSPNHLIEKCLLYSRQKSKYYKMCWSSQKKGLRQWSSHKPILLRFYFGTMN